jgi:hypothetical protein
MIEDPTDHDWVLDAGNHLDRVATLLTCFDIDLEHVPESKADGEA